MSVDAGAASIYGTKKLKIVTKDPTSAPFQIDLQYGWSYQRPITITNTGAALTDYQVLFTVDTAALITAGKMQSAGQDIRITDSDLTTMLSFWVESGINTTTTKIWVKVPSVPNGSKTIYLYYGNVNAADIQSGINTFIFFDDFSGDLSKWNITGSVNISSGAAMITGANSWNTNGITSKTTLTKPVVIEWKSKVNNAIHSMEGFSIEPLNVDKGVFWNLHNLGSYYSRVDSGSTLITTYSTGVFIPKKLIIPSGNGFNFFWDNVEKVTNTTWTNPNAANVCSFMCYSADYFYIDDVRVRKYVATEPSSNVGAEIAATTGIGSAIQTIFKVAESSGNVGIRVSTPSNILTIQQNSLTDPIADSWTTWPCDRTTKILLRELTGPEALPELAKIRLYEWKKKPRRDDISMPKFNAARIGMMIDDPEVPARILTYDMNGKLQGIDLLAYCGFLHVAMKELSIKVAALEAKLPP